MSVSNINSNNKGLIDELIRSGVLRTNSIIQAFIAIDRRDFVNKDTPEIVIYSDTPQQIGFGQTISQPYTVAFMLELLQPKKGQKILDIGSGSGWTTAILANIVGETGMVTGLEIIEELVKFGNDNLAKYPNLNAEILKAKKGILGLPEEKFDRILVSASAEYMPIKLYKQLKSDGILVIPIQQSIWRVFKNDNGEISTEEYPGFVFVKLVQN